MQRTRGLACLFVAASALGVPVRAQRGAPVASGAFILRLGRDTVAVEQYRRFADRIEGELVQRVPTTVLVRYKTQWRDDGSVTRSVARIEPLGSVKAEARTLTLEFRGDSLRMTVDSGALHRVQATAADRWVVPMIAGPYATSYAMYEWLLGRTSPGDTGGRPMVSPTTLRTNAATWLRTADGAGAIDFFGEGWMPVVFADGRIERVDASRMTVRVSAERVAAADVVELARGFASLDRAGQSLGVASPPDSVRANVQGVGLAVDYGSPRRRGRRILGALVPYDTVWRTGANAATILRIDDNLRFGSQVVPKGSYSVWTVPRRAGVELVLNTQTGQWGTEHDAARDAFSIPMTVATSTDAVEALRIELQGQEFTIRWDTFVWSLTVQRP